MDRASKVQERANAKVPGVLGVRGVHEVPGVLTTAARQEAFSLIMVDPSIFTEDAGAVFRLILGQSTNPFAFLRTGDPVCNLTREDSARRGRWERLQVSAWHGVRGASSRVTRTGPRSGHPPRWALFTWDEAGGSYYGGDSWCWKLNSPELCKQASDLLSTWQAGGGCATVGALRLYQGS